MGHLRGVVTQLEREEPSALRVHCFAHCLNLCPQNVAQKCQPIRNALDSVMELSQLIRYSPKRSLVFQQCEEELSPEGTGLQPLCSKDRGFRCSVEELCCYFTSPSGDQ